MPLDTTGQRNFTFTRNDSVVVALLTPEEIKACKRWQTYTDAYTFEFHNMHTTGYPIYFRPDGNTSGSSMPKIDTKNIPNGGTKYAVITSLANPRVLTDALDGKQQQEILDIVKDSWATLQIMAQRYWTKTDPPSTAARSEMRCPSCSISYFDRDLGKAKFGKYQCPKCKKYVVKPV